MVKRRRRHFEEQVYDEIHRLVREEGLTNAAQIYDRLLRAFPKDKLPSDRTVRSIVRELTPSDPSGPWAPDPEQPAQQAALILEAWAVLLEESEGRLAKNGLSQDLARWIGWLRTGWPDLYPMMAAVMAQDYRARRAAGRTTSDLDGFLAFAPWRSLEAAERYALALENGWIPRKPYFYKARWLGRETLLALDKQSRRRYGTISEAHDQQEAETCSEEPDATGGDA